MACGRLHVTQAPLGLALHNVSAHPVPGQAAESVAASQLDRWIRDAKEQRLQRKVLRMRLQSDAAQLQRELHELQDRMHAERKLQQSLDQQLRDVRRARLASDANATRQWQLGAVQLYHNRVVQAAPVQVGCTHELVGSPAATAPSSAEGCWHTAPHAKLCGCTLHALEHPQLHCMHVRMMGTTQHAHMHWVCRCSAAGLSHGFADSGFLS
jgi:hypothetical protein